MLKKLTSSIGGLLIIVSGLLTWIFMMIALINWWGLIGFVASFIFTPGVIIFPFIFWIVENQFPVAYFSAWGLGLLGILMLAVKEK